MFKLLAPSLTRLPQPHNQRFDTYCNLESLETSHNRLTVQKSIFELKLRWHQNRLYITLRIQTLHLAVCHEVPVWL